MGKFFMVNVNIRRDNIELPITPEDLGINMQNIIGDLDDDFDTGSAKIYLIPQSKQQEFDELWINPL